MNLVSSGSTVRRRCVGALLAVGLAAAGCAAPLTTSYLSGSRQRETALAADDATRAPADLHDPKTAALRKATGQTPATPDEALAGVLDELREIGAIDPAAQQQLIADLKAANPEHYGLIVEQFRAALAYRRQLAARELGEQSQLAAEAPADRVPTVTAKRVDAPAGATLVSIQPTAPAPPDVETPAPVTVSSPAPAETAVVATANVTPGAPSAVQQATVQDRLTAAADWRAELDAAIANLQRTVRPQPGTIAELHDHFRLRALLLVAGRDEEAYQPIPGASPAQQDYWSKQLFAMNAYLGDAPAMDDKQRAAAALVHLDDARAALTQLATLQIRNLAFVKAVSGFGAYEPIKHAEFEPGAPVTLYAEVENFASTATAAGYETTLATSYQVIDATGRRLDGAQFPDVSDLCRGRRRDFHLQYGVTLPAPMAPGQYRLELTITDQRSGKIGQATLPFEITAVR